MNCGSNPRSPSGVLCCKRPGNTANMTFPICVYQLVNFLSKSCAHTSTIFWSGVAASPLASLGSSPAAEQPPSPPACTWPDDPSPTSLHTYAPLHMRMRM